MMPLTNPQPSYDAPAVTQHCDVAPEVMMARADDASTFLKALAHEGRLMILCHLAEGEKSVSELEGLIGLRQAAVSQQLARLRLEGLLSTRRKGKAIIYALRDPGVIAVLSCLHRLFGART